MRGLVRLAAGGAVPVFPVVGAGVRGAVQDLRPLAEQQGLTMAQLAIAWVLSNDNVAGAIIGASRPEQVVSNVEAAGRTLEPEVLEAIDDILGELPEKDAESYLERMNPEDSSNVRRLLTFDADTAGGLMTPEPIILSPQTTVAEALAHCRNPDLSPALASLVFVVRPPTATPTGKYLGCVHIQALLRELPSAMVAETVDTSLSALRPTDSVDAVTRFFATYNLVCGPVVDDEGHLLGAVAVDDLLDHLLPDDWRDMDLHDDTETAR